MKKETTSRSEVYPRVVRIHCTDKGKGIYMVSFFPAKGAVMHKWGLLAQDELDAWRRVQQEFKRRQKNKVTFYGDEVLLTDFGTFFGRCVDD